MCFRFRSVVLYSDYLGFALMCDVLDISSVLPKPLLMPKSVLLNFSSGCYQHVAFSSFNFPLGGGGFS